MKKITKRILIFVIALPFIIFLPDAHIYYERYKVRQNPLPQKYRNVAELQDLKDDIYEVKSYSIFSVPTMVNDSTVVLSNMDKKSTNRGDVWTSNGSR